MYFKDELSNICDKKVSNNLCFQVINSSFNNKYIFFNELEIYLINWNLVSAENMDYFEHDTLED